MVRGSVSSRTPPPKLNSNSFSSRRLRTATSRTSSIFLARPSRRTWTVDIIMYHLDSRSPTFTRLQYRILHYHQHHRLVTLANILCYIYYVLAWGREIRIYVRFRLPMTYALGMCSRVPQEVAPFNSDTQYSTEPNIDVVWTNSTGTAPGFLRIPGATLVIPILLQDDAWEQREQAAENQYVRAKASGKKNPFDPLLTCAHNHRGPEHRKPNS